MTETVRELIEAARANDRAQVKTLLDREPGLLQETAPAGESPLLAAIYTGAWDTIELLLSRGATHDLFTAAATGNVVLLPGFLDADPEAVRRTTYDGWTPLHLAAFFGHPDAARLLLERGADVHARSTNRTDNQPLHAAAVRGQRDVMELLLAHGADVNAVAGGGYTPLHLAAAQGDPACVELLLAHGADLEAQEHDGLTPLAHALKRGHASVIERLRAAGAKG